MKNKKNKKNKKWTTMVLMGILALNITACGGQSASPAPEKSTEAVVETEAPETEAPETQVPETNAPEEQIPVREVFPELLDVIYRIYAGSAGFSLRAEGAMDQMDAFIEIYGSEITAEECRQMTESWFETAEATKEDFARCLDALEWAYMARSYYDPAREEAFTDIVAGIRTVCGEWELVEEGEDGGDPEDAEAAARQQDLYEVLDAIYDVRAGSAGCSIRGETARQLLVPYVFNYGVGCSAEEFTQITRNWIQANDINVEWMPENLELVDSQAIQEDDSLEEDAAYRVVMDGIRAALEN